MGIDHYTVIQLGAALSMIGWMTRSPDYQLNVNYSHHNDYFGHVRNYFHQDDQLSAAMVETQLSIYQINDNFHESKYMRDDFRTVSELQDLVSWQESYRRGDFSFGRNARYIYPVANYEINNEGLFPELQSLAPNYYDDGYGSGETNIGSPELSDLSSVSLSSDNGSVSSSPVSSHISEFDNLSGCEDLPGAIGYSLPEEGNFDLDVGDLLDDFDPIADPFPGAKDIHSKILSNSYVEDLSYSNSPLLDPSFDEYLSRVIPSDQNNHSFDTLYDDPFRIDFINSSLPNGKYVAELSESELNFGDSTLVNEFHDYGDGLQTGALSGKEDGLQMGALSEKVIGNQQAKKEDNLGLNVTSTVHPYSSKVTSNLIDHDYAACYKDEKVLDSEAKKAVNSITTSFQRYQQSDLEKASTIKHTRTYAPLPRTSFSPQATGKAESTFICPDFPYTSEDLIDMSIDDFNDVISKLDESKQTIAKDIRKKGKNKLAARNCRKRKMDILGDLDSDVDTLERQKDRLLLEQQLLLEETRLLHEKTEILNNYILEHLFDGNDGSYSPSEFTLEYTVDGNVYVVPHAVKGDGKRIQDV